MKFNPLIIVMSLCVLAEIALGIMHQPVPPIIEHVMLVLLGVLVPQEQFQPVYTPPDGTESRFRSMVPLVPPTK